MKAIRYLALALTLVLVTAGLAACGGDSDDGDAAAAGGSMSMTDTTGEPGSSGAPAVDTAAADLRVVLTQILGEHATLAVFATQKGFSGDPDFEQIAAALDENSAALGDVLAQVYGEEAADQFLNGELLWRDHIGFFVDYTVGLAKKDKAAQQKAVDNLMAYREAVSVFLSDATGLPREALAGAIDMHIGHLKGQIDAYAAGDYEQAYRLTREAYAHMEETATTLASGIVAQNPEMFGA
jgi:hypothetical protein